MDVIYEPKGKAAEYAPLAVNLFTGCVHWCKYCYAPSTLRKSRAEFHIQVAPRKNILDRLAKDAATLTENVDDREILLCFMCDPYQPFEIEQGITRGAIKILIEHGLRFTILTKGGIRAARDFDLLKGYPKCSFGTTLTSDNFDIYRHWEPNAPSPVERMEVIRFAKALLIRTWVSLEPVLDAASAFSLVSLLHPHVNHWKVGKLNYHATGINWPEFRQQIVAELAGLGADYYIKKSLAEA